MALSGLPSDDYVSDFLSTLPTTTRDHLFLAANAVAEELEDPELGTGMQILDAKTPQDVLRLAAELGAYPRIADREGRRNRAARTFPPERIGYGYDGVQFEAKGARTAARVMVCVAADIWFAPYAKGLMDATRPLGLRVELRSATSLVWNWGTFDHPPLARALSAARNHNGRYMPFGPFTLLYERVLLMHRHDEPRWCAAVAERLSQLTLERLWYAKPGKAALANIFIPALELIRDEFALDLSVGLPQSSSEELARAAAPWCREVFLRQRSAPEAVTRLRQIAGSLERLGSDLDA